MKTHILPTVGTLVFELLPTILTASDESTNPKEEDQQPTSELNGTLNSSQTLKKVRKINHKIAEKNISTKMFHKIKQNYNSQEMDYRLPNISILFP